MTVRPRYSKEEFAQHGDEIYESQIRSQVEIADRGKIVAITSGRLTPTISTLEPLKLMRVK